MKNYAPVTDEMMLHPSNNDWLMHSSSSRAPTGYSGGGPEQKPTTMLSGEINRPTRGHGVFVFALPKAGE